MGLDHGCLFGNRPRVRPATRGGRSQYRARGPAACVAGGGRTRVREGVWRGVPRRRGISLRRTFLETLAEATEDLEIGLVVSNAGTVSPGLFLSNDRDELAGLLRLNTLAHLDIAHHFGKKLVPEDAAGWYSSVRWARTRAFRTWRTTRRPRRTSRALAQGLHVELKPRGVHVTVVSPGPTETPVLGETRPYADEHADEADEGRASRLRGYQRPPGQPLANNSRTAEPDDECGDPRIDHTGDEGEDVCQDACQQVDCPPTRAEVR